MGRRRRGKIWSRSRETQARKRSREIKGNASYTRCIKRKTGGGERKEGERGEGEREEGERGEGERGERRRKIKNRSKGGRSEGKAKGTCGAAGAEGTEQAGGVGMKL